VDGKKCIGGAGDIFLSKTESDGKTD